MSLSQPLTPCLWFDSQAEEAARFYTGIFKDSKIVAITRYPEAGQEIHGRAPGSVMTVEFELNGQPFTALNGGPHFKPTGRKYPETVVLRLIDPNGRPEVKIGASVEGGGLSLVGDSDETRILLEADGAKSTLRLTAESGGERLIQP